MFYTYILQSQKDGSYYVGYSSNVDKRLEEHNSGKVRYTKGHKSYKIVHMENYEEKKLAKQKEKKIKNRGAKRYLEIIGSPAS